MDNQFILRFEKLNLIKLFEVTALNLMIDKMLIFALSGVIKDYLYQVIE